MDDRQRTIVEGAGLEESRLNQDFVEFLRKWGTPLLLVVVVVAGVYAGATMWSRHQETSHNTAYTEFHHAAVSGSPDNLVIVAEQHKGRGAVYQLALLEAADAYLESARLGLRPGGDPTKAEDQLTPEQVTANLSRAGEIYAQIINSTNRKPALAIHHLSGLFGQAAVAESLGRLDEARSALNRVADVAESEGFAELASIAQARIESLDEIAAPPRMYDRAEVRSSAQQTPGVPAPMNTQLGGSLTPNAPADPFHLGDGPLPAPPPGVTPAQPADEGAPDTPTP